jgi:hypothetical protein
MFIRYFVEVNRPFDEVEAELLRAPAEWIPDLAGEAEARGEGLLAEVGFGKVLRVERTVRIEFGAPARLEAKTLLPVKWRPAAGGPALPGLDGDLELAAVGPRRSQLSMTASYEPPFGLIGRLADRALLHRVAEATVKDFVDRIARALIGRLGSPGRSILSA